MRDQEFLLRCAHCGKDTRIILKVPTTFASGSGQKVRKIQITKDCEHCHHPNIINVPETWNPSELILGKDIVGSRNGVPIIQGEKEFP